MQVYDIPINEHQRETTQHGPSTFPLAVYHSIMSQNVFGFTPWHWHEELQFCRVLRGAICYHVNQRRFLAKEGDGIFINSGILHMAAPEGSPDSAYLCLDVGLPLLRGFSGSVFEERYLTPYLNDQSLDAVLLSHEVPEHQEILAQIAEIGSLHESGGFGCELGIASRLYALWELLIQQIPADHAHPSSRSQTNITVQKILRYIELRYKESITMADIAEEVSFSASECCRMFKRVTGETIFSYLNDYRLEQSALLLRNTSLSVSHIAYETGFGSTSYFIKIFKKRFSVTPLRYREKRLDRI